MCEIELDETFLRKISAAEVESVGDRFVADEAKATRLPSVEIDGAELLLLAVVPVPDTLTRTVALVVVLRRYMCLNPELAAETRLVASDSKTT